MVGSVWLHFPSPASYFRWYLGINKSGQITPRAFTTRGSCFPVQRHPSHFLPRLHVLPDYSRRRRNTTRSVSTLSGISTESVFSSYGVKHQGRLFSLGFPAYFLYSGECPVAGPAPCYVLAGARPDNRLQGQLPSNWFALAHMIGISWKKICSPLLSDEIEFKIS